MLETARTLRQREKHFTGRGFPGVPLFGLLANALTGAGRLLGVAPGPAQAGKVAQGRCGHPGVG